MVMEAQYWELLSAMVHLKRLKVLNLCYLNFTSIKKYFLEIYVFLISPHLFVVHSFCKYI